MKRKQGRVTERSRTVREEKKGKEENSFHRKGLCFLTCLLMGDPERTASLEHKITVAPSLGLSAHRRHFWKFGQRRIHMIPRLGASCEDVKGRLIQAWVIEAPGRDHREVRHRTGLSEQTSTALRAKTSAQCITTVCFSVVILNRTRDL